MDIKLKKSIICHALRKISVMSTNIFVFNAGKSWTEDEINYELLKKIKNGKNVAAKLNSTELNSIHQTRWWFLAHMR